MFELLLGHLVGDYLLQTEWMAQNKAKNTLEGWLAAIVHCVAYTGAVCFLMWKFDWYWWIAVFFSHFFIDKFALGYYYLKFLKGLDTYAYKSVGEYNELRAGFNAVIYTITDNTMHLVLMWGAYKLIY
jgi:hypothetical protein